ncbi:MAG TPA: class I SAM-dependent methyltransferase [Cytophagaceae bacterium]|jgi:2-polyprenyl-3-methyl-5-hydroxy-6-metoxy-1,4-benzoquinol methylase|nr:class I SAM-dependent methyltransferase [Cytophagaceae bacterium]
MSEMKINTYPVTTCMVCGSKGQDRYKDLTDSNYGATSGWNLNVCSKENCGLLWLNPMPTKDEISKAYTSYYTHSSQTDAVANFPFLQKAYLALRYNYFSEMTSWKKTAGLFVFLMPIMKNKFDNSVMYLENSPKGKILDFGCGNGWLLKNLKSLGWEVNGLDFDAKAVEFCNSLNLNVCLGDIRSQNYPDNYFDAITINHVIEHVHEVDELIKDAYKVLKKGGELIIATPNTQNWQHKLYGKFWFQLDPPRHLHIFNIDNLEKVVKRNGFEVHKSFSSIRMDAWSTIVTRGVIRKGDFKIGVDKKKISDLIIGIVHQHISWILSIFNKKYGGEIIVISKKK